MYDISKHPFFEEYIDPKTGVKSYILKERVAFAQQNFYFCNQSLTPDGKYLWIRCINPPARIISLAVVSLDPENPFIRNIPGAGSSGNGNFPSLIPGTNDVVFAEEDAVYRVDVEGNIKKIISLDENIVRNRIPNRVFTHASVSCDGKKVALDSFIADATYMSVGDMETGETTLITKMGGIYNHAQFSPVDPNLILLDQDGWENSYSGEHFVFNNRMWLMGADGKYMEPVIPTSWFGHDGSMLCHDFWALDGTLCYIDYKKGAYECDIKTREHIHVWKRPVCHAHTNFDRSLWVGDQTPYEWAETPCRVIFYDRKTNKELDIFSALPYPNIDFRNSCYHTDPHPTFTDNGKYILSMTTVKNGQVDVAVTPVEPLIEQCRQNGTVVE